MDGVLISFGPIEWFSEVTDLAPADVFILLTVCTFVILALAYLTWKERVSVWIVVIIVCVAALVAADMTAVLQQRNQQLRRQHDSYERCEGAIDPSMIHFCARTLTDLTTPKWKFVVDQLKSHIYDIYWNMFGMFMINGFYQFIMLVAILFGINTYKEYLLVTRVQDNSWKREERILDAFEQLNQRQITLSSSSSSSTSALPASLSLDHQQEEESDSSSSSPLRTKAGKWPLSLPLFSSMAKKRRTTTTTTADTVINPLSSSQPITAGGGHDEDGDEQSESEDEDGGHDLD